MAAPKPQPNTRPDSSPSRCRLTVSGQGTLTLPASLVAGLGLGLEPGDAVEVAVGHSQAVLRRVAEPDAPGLPNVTGADSAVTESPRGLLRDYFTDWEDVKRFVEKERHGWAEREERLERLYREARGPNGTSTTS